MSNPKQAAGTTGLFVQIDSDLHAAFQAKCRADGVKVTRQVEKLIAKWLKVPVPVRRGAGQPRKE